VVIVDVVHLDGLQKLNGMEQIFKKNIFKLISR